MLFDRLHRGTALLWAAGTGILAATAIALAANRRRRAMTTPRSPKASPPCCAPAAPWCRGIRTPSTTPSLANKGFDAKTVLAEAIKIYQDTAGVDPMSIDPNSRHGKLIRMQMDSIAEVIASHQETINRKGVGFKGFIPAVFGRLTNESFGRRAVGLAEMKVTAPPQFIRNVKAKADDWESGVIRDKLLLASWPKDQLVRRRGPGQGQARPSHRGAGILRRLVPQLPRLAAGRDRHHRLSQRGRQGRRSRRGHQHHALQVGTAACQRPILAANS